MFVYKFQIKKNSALAFSSGSRLFSKIINIHNERHFSIVTTSNDAQTFHKSKAATSFTK